MDRIYVVTRRGRRRLLLCAAATAVITLSCTNQPQQKRTIADIRTIATTVESYAVEYGQYPATLAEAESKLFPAGHTLPKVDGWDNAYAYACWKTRADSRGCDSFAVASAGADGKFEHSDLRAYHNQGPLTGSDRDLIFAFTELPPANAQVGSLRGEFLQYPAGLQPNTR